MRVLDGRTRKWTDDQMNLTFGHGALSLSLTGSAKLLRYCIGQTRINLLLNTSPSSAMYTIEQVVLKECDDASSKRSNVPIRKDGVYHVLSLFETPLDHRPLWAELSSHLLPVATKEDPTLLFRKSHNNTCPSSLAFAKWTR